jgi:hypothetical protein
MKSAIESPSRAVALLLMLLLHGLGLGLLRLPTLPGPPVSQRLELSLERAPEPRRAEAPQALPPAGGAGRAFTVPLPSWSTDLERPQSPMAPTIGEPAAAPSPPAPTPAPLNLSLPPPEARTRLPAIAEQLRHDPRANSPMPSGQERMAAALGAKGWTVLDLGDGGKKITGPLGECSIVRPSMVDGIAGHPHAGMLPNRVFPCGGIEKGSLVHARPHERKR